MTRVLTSLCLAFWAWPASLSADPAESMAAAIEQIRTSNWEAARESVRRDSQVARDIVEWHRLRAGLGEYPDVLAFLERNSDWPGIAWLRRKSEPAMANADHDVILEYYAAEAPQTAEGVLSYARALEAKDRPGEAEASIVLAWRTMPMGRTVQQNYLRDHGDLLKPHHAARLDRLLWDRHLVSARRMLPLVDDGNLKLAEARIALHELAPGVDARIEAVPANLQSAPGLAFERFEWRARKGRTEDAVELLLDRSASPASLGEPDKWGKRRRGLARQAMRAGDHRLAYQIASQNHLTEGSDYADLEWLSGFVALRLLQDPATALRHFQNFDGAVSSPISKGRAGYWLGRAHEALGDSDAAAAAYAQGANYQTSFYGLLSAERGGVAFDADLAKPPDLPPWRQAAFMGSSVLEASLLLLDAGEINLAERFLTHLVEGLDPVQAGQLGNMAVELGHPHLAVMIGKRAARTGQVLPGAYYPLHPVADMALPMAPEMTLAIARRESEFDPVVISGAGARGLMQVMPATARLVAGQMGVIGSHTTGRLLSDWRYNAQLGATYLAGLAGDFNGNVVMMSAGYNAGPGRPSGWMGRYGDPRQPGGPDIVDWIEFIPFNETRNYVMRVTESLPVYRARLGEDPLPVPFSEELVGSTLRTYAP